MTGHAIHTSAANDIGRRAMAKWAIFRRDAPNSERVRVVGPLLTYLEAIEAVADFRRNPQPTRTSWYWAEKVVA